MEDMDTINLLKECDSGSKMAVASIDEVLDKVSDSKLKSMLEESKKSHTNLGNRLHDLLLRHGSDDKEPNPAAKGMAWLKTNIKIGMNDSDRTIADLITDGCDMGIKSLYKYLNQYKDADKDSSKICNELIEIEEDLRDGLHCYL